MLATGYTLISLARTPTLVVDGFRSVLHAYQFFSHVAMSHDLLGLLMFSTDSPDCNFSTQAMPVLFLQRSL